MDSEGRFATKIPRFSVSSSPSQQGQNVEVTLRVKGKEMQNLWN